MICQTRNAVRKKKRFTGNSLKNNVAQKMLYRNTVHEMSSRSCRTQDTVQKNAVSTMQYRNAALESLFRTNCARIFHRGKVVLNKMYNKSTEQCRTYNGVPTILRIR